MKRDFLRSVGVLCAREKNQVKIWRSDEERLHPDCIQQVNTGMGEKLGIWEGISAQGPTKTRIFDENVDEQMYCHIFNGEYQWPNSMTKTK